MLRISIIEECATYVCEPSAGSDAELEQPDVEAHSQDAPALVRRAQHKGQVLHIKVVTRALSLQITLPDKHSCVATHNEELV